MTCECCFDGLIQRAIEEGQLYGDINYKLDLFEASTIALMAERFEMLLQSIVHNPDEHIDCLEFLTLEERRHHQRKKRRDQK